MGKNRRQSQPDSKAEGGDLVVKMRDSFVVDKERDEDRETSEEYSDDNR